MTGEFLLEGPCGGLPIVLKFEEAFGDSVETGKVVGGQNLALDDGEVDFDLIEPTGMDRSMDEGEARIAMAQTRDGSVATVCRAVIHDPENAPGVVIRGSCHHLFDQAVKGGDAILRFTTAKDAGAVDIQGGEIGPGAAAGVLVFDVHGSVRPATVRSMLAPAGLNAGLFIRGDHEFIILQRLVSPLAGIEIQHAAGLAGKVRVTGEDPTAVIPGPNGVMMQPAPQRAAADRGDQTALLNLLHQVAGTPAGERSTVLGGQFARQGSNLHDEVGGKKSGGVPDEHVLPGRRGAQ